MIPGADRLRDDEPVEWTFVPFRPAPDVCGPCKRGDHTACEGGDGLRMTGCGCYVRREDDAHDWTAELTGDEA